MQNNIHLTVHPFAQYVPEISPADFQILVEKIRAHGQIDKIVVRGTEILDGRARYDACQALGIEPQIEEWNGAGGSVLEFILSRNLVRRHLSASQRALVCARIANMQQGARTDLRETGAISQAQAAEMLGVSDELLRSARTVLELGCSDVIEMVEANELSVSAAAVAVRDIPLTKQKRMIRSEREKFIRAARRKTNRRAESSLRNAELELGSIVESVGSFVTHLVNLREAAKAIGNSEIPRYIDDVVFEILETETANTYQSNRERILYAVKRGFREFGQLQRLLKIDRAELKMNLAHMVDYGLLVMREQEGKSEDARGARKPLYFLPEEKPQLAAKPEAVAQPEDESGYEKPAFIPNIIIDVSQSSVHLM